MAEGDGWGGASHAGSNHPRGLPPVLPLLIQGGELFLVLMSPCITAQHDPPRSHAQSSRRYVGQKKATTNQKANSSWLPSCYRESSQFGLSWHCDRRNRQFYRPTDLRGHQVLLGI